LGKKEVVLTGKNSLEIFALIFNGSGETCIMPVGNKKHSAYVAGLARKQANKNYPPE
jgi:hypothetical protein